MSAALDGWERVSPHSIKRGEWAVSKLMVRGEPGYLLWRRNGAMFGARFDLVAPCHLTAEAAATRAAELEGPEAPNGRTDEVA